MLIALALAFQAAQVPLYDNLGSLTHRISSRVPNVQAYFDQGLRLTYGFNHAEAIRAYREAARLDSTCAICWWGVAYAYGPNINAGMDSASGAAAWDALQRAVALRAHASTAERAYIDALVPRYGANPMADRAQRDSAYARAMTALARRYPADNDAVTLAAEAQLDLRPWDYWRADSTVQPGMGAAIASLARIVARAPNHPGACHFYIHAVEAGPYPERALPCARRLASLMPGVGHLVHMPGHIYIRLGMYEDARVANIHAAHTDESYIADARPDPGAYTMGYYPHNLHFLWAVAAFDGRREAADSAMARLRTVAPAEMALQVPPLEQFLLPAYYHLVWFGKWDEILREPRPAASLRVATGLWQYARGRAFTATGRMADAHRELDSLTALHADVAANTPPGVTLGLVAPKDLLSIAMNILAGEVAAREGRTDEAVTRLRDAIRLNDGFRYTEPADWYYPPRLSLGAILLAAGRAGDAEAVYREDLARNRANGWALTGLVKALEAQNKTAEAARARAQLRQAWAHADVEPTTSRF